MDDAEMINSRIKSLEAQLRVLLMQIRSASTQPEMVGHLFADLHGKLSGKVESSEEEIDAVLYKLPVD